VNGVQKYGKTLRMGVDMHAALRDRLAGAAENIIKEQGLTALRARDLAQQVNCAVGMIYKLFPDLDAIVVAVNSRTLAEIAAAIEQTRTDADARAAVRASDPAPVMRLVQLALAYFDYAVANRHRWQALFTHNVPAIPQWHHEEHRQLFARLEAPVRALIPAIDDETCGLTSRSLFSAVHGVVSLGLDETLTTISLPALRRQTAVMAAAASRGLA
jgi:AcrR family transcriptional regulator